MKVLILHQHFNTPEKGGAIRSYYLAKALVDRGIQVIVISGHNEKKFKKEFIEGIEVHYLPISYDNRFGFFARGISFLRYAWRVMMRAGNFKDADVCYSISVPLTVGLAAMWIKWRYKIPYIFEVGDLWPEAPIQIGFIRNYFFKQFLYQLEKSIYERSDSIVALSPMIQSNIEKKVSHKTVHLLPNMADTEFYKPEDRKAELEKKFNVEGKFVVSYIGAIGFANGLDYFLECARASQKAKLLIHFLMCGDGAMLENLKQSAKRLGLLNLLFIPFQNREGVREVMNVTDAIFVSYKNIPILETGSPNKYFDGLAAGKLIIINFGGWIKDEIEKQHCGIAVDPKHPTDFVKQVEPFLQNSNLLKQYQQSGRLLAELKYSRKILSEKFCGIIELTKPEFFQ